MKRLILAVSALLSSAVIAATTTPVQLLNPTGSTAGQAIVSTGPTGAPAWGSVTATALAPVAANTVIANATAGSAAPTAHAVPSCSTANSALKWTSGTGLSCGTTFALTSGNLSQFASTTSAQLLALLSDETGTGSSVFSISPAFTGTPTAPTAAVDTNTTQLATTAYVVGQGYAKLASPTFTGTPAAPTAAAGTNTTQLATTAYVRGEYASPPAIGSTTPAAGTFTTLRGNSLAKVIADTPTAQSVANNTVTDVTNWTERVDTGSNFNPTTGVFTAPRTGHYIVSGVVSYASAAQAVGSEASALLYKNGSQARAARFVVAAAATLALQSPYVTVDIDLAANDTLKLSAFQTSGGAVNTVSNINTVFTIVEVP